MLELGQKVASTERESIITQMGTTMMGNGLRTLQKGKER